MTPALDWDVGEEPELWDAGPSGRNPIFQLQALRKISVSTAIESERHCKFQEN